jgi:hypothetical protein
MKGGLCCDIRKCQELMIREAVGTHRFKYYISIVHVLDETFPDVSF